MENLSNRNPVLSSILNTLLNSLSDIVVIVITGWLIYQLQFDPPESISDEIAPILSSILAILLLSAISNFNQNRRLTLIQTKVSENSNKVDSYFDQIPVNRCFFPSSVDVSQSVESLIKGPSDSLVLLGITLGRTLRTYQPEIENKLREGCDVRIMIVSHDIRSLVDELASRSGREESEIWKERLKATANQVDNVINRVKRSQEGQRGQLNNSKIGKLEIGFLPFMPSFGIIMINPNTIKGKAMVEVYHHDVTPLNATFQLDAVSDNFWFTIYCEQIEILWKKCVHKKAEDFLPPPAKEDDDTE